MKALVTGGAGFIGRAVVGWCLNKGWKVRVLDDLSNGRQQNLMEYEANPGYMGLQTGDIRKAEDDLRAVEGVDVVYHLAAKINVHDSLTDPRSTWQSDADGTFELLEAARSQGVKRFVFVSTCMVYDIAGATTVISEEHPVIPKSPYAATKLAGEFLTLSYGHGYGMAVSVVRPFNTYGPYQKTSGEGGVIATFIRNQLNKKPLTIYGSGEQTRDFLYVDDCARLIGLAGITEAAVGRVINGGTGKDITVNKLAEAVAAREVEIKHVTHIHPQSEIWKLCGSNMLAQKLLGWSPEVDLEEGLKRTRTWIEKEQGNK